MAGLRLLDSVGKKVGFGLLLGGTAIHGFAKGMRNPDGSGSISSSLYDFALGDPNADQSILGTRYSLGDMLTPLGFEKRHLAGISQFSGNAGGLAGGVLGGVAGALPGVMLAAKGHGRAKILGGGLAAVGGILGVGAGAAGGYIGGRLAPMARSGLLNRTTLADYAKYYPTMQQNRNSIQMPQVSGDVVLGSYNLRH